MKTYYFGNIDSLLKAIPMSKRLSLLALILLLATTILAQTSASYAEWITKAQAFYDAKQFRQAAETFTKAFNTMDGKAYPTDRYNAACSWSLAGIKDSAFYHLTRLITKTNYKDLSQLLNDHDLDNLHSDRRWNELVDIVKQNKEKAEANLNKPLVAILDTVFRNDQDLRNQIRDVAQKYGQQSKEMTDLWTTISYNDSIDLIKVTAIIDKYGWLGADVVGEQGNETIFLVIQHSDIKVQDKYLPMMREAVKNKKASAASLALLEDRVALRHGKKQIYGSQITGHPDGSFLAPLEDPDNVDKRRAEVGLEPLADYLARFHIAWNLEEYKKQLPEIEKKQKHIYKTE
jgi:hypothetical protein